jgi:hypothetical protein
MGAVLEATTTSFVKAAVFAAGLLSAAAASAAPGALACLGEVARAEVAAVPDWRTAMLADGRQLRLAGIESFALLIGDEAAADAALKGRIETALAGKTSDIRIVASAPDRYGRLPALIASDDGTLVQEVVTREGLALAFGTGERLPCFESLLLAESEARQRRRGFWAAYRIPGAWPEALAPRVGRFAIFEGTVDSVGSRRQRTYLNFGGRWSTDVTVAIDRRHRERFGGEAELAGWSGRKLRVRGFLEERGGPLVNVTSPMQIEVLSEAVKVEGEAP